MRQGRVLTFHVSTAVLNYKLWQRENDVAGKKLVGSKEAEWKECRASIDRFDKILVDLRKTGFGLAAVLVGAAAYIFKSGHKDENSAMAAMVALLITTLYLLDCKHQVWLRVTVARAKKLEADLGFELTGDLAGKFNAAVAGLLGLWLYALLLGVSCVYFWIAIPNVQSGINTHRIIILIFGLASALTMALATHRSFPYKDLRTPSDTISFAVGIVFYSALAISAELFPGGATG
jgi:hypothetical protein